MRTYRTTLPAPIPTDDGTVVSVETYYDPHLRLWTGIADDANGYQVGSAVYGTSKAEAFDSAVFEARVRLDPAAALAQATATETPEETPMTETTTTLPTLTPASRDLFAGLWRDRLDWSGTPLVEVSRSERGNLSHLKRAGLLDTFDSDGCLFASFTDLGNAYGAAIDAETGVTESQQAAADAIAADPAPVPVPAKRSRRAAAPAETPATKTCTSCKQDLPRSAFSARATARDGLNPRCRTCRAAYRSGRRAARKAAAAAPRYTVVRDPGDARRWAVDDAVRGEPIATGLTKRQAAAEVASLLRAESN